MTSDEIKDLFAPSQKSIDDVKEWLTASGVPADSIKVSSGRGWIHFNTTAGQLGSLLKTEYHHYNTKDASRTFFGTDSYSLPHDISSVVDFVHPGTGFSKMQKRTKGGSGPALVKPHDQAIDPSAFPLPPT